MKVVVDTNVVVSAVLRGGKPARLLQLVVEHSDIELIGSDEILAEYTEVL